MGSVYPRGNKLWIAYRDATGKRRCRATRLQVGQEALARDLLAKVEATLGAGDSAPTGKAAPPTVAEAARFYLENHGQHTKSAGKIRTVNRRLARHLGRRPADAIRQADVDRYVRDRTGAGASGKTVWNELAQLRTVLRYAWKNDLLPSPPRFTLHKPKSERSRVVWPDEARAIFEAAPLDLRRILVAMYTTGMRRGEVLAMTWAMVNTTTQDALLPAELTKTEEEKRVAFGPQLWAMIHVEPVHPTHVFGRFRQGLNGKSTTTTVEPWTVASLQRAMKALRDDLGVEHFTFHDLRRSMASVAAERGHSQRTVQEVGGWRDPGVLQRHYSRASDRAKRALSADLEAATVADRATESATVHKKSPQLRGLTGWRRRDLNPGHYGYEPYALTS